MKTKKSSFGKPFLSKKRFALVEIVIVLCSVFLVAIPAIAADQNQAMQKVSASTITTASEDDYVLGIYGNANEDDTIDMGDVVYTKLAIFGKKPKTELCDAKYDGRINVLDVIQTKLIILGKEKELTVVDSADRIVTMKKPLKRIVATFRGQLEQLQIVKLESERIVGVSSIVQSEKYGGGYYKILFPEYQDKPTVGNLWGPDIEAILNLNPDAVLLIASSWREETTKKATGVLESAGIAVLRFYGGIEERSMIPEEVKKYGYIFDKEDEAEEFIDWYEGAVNPIVEKVKKIPEEDKPKVYYEGGKYSAYGDIWAHVEESGGKNIFSDVMTAYGVVDVDPEAVIERDPDIIIRAYSGDGCGYHLDADDTAEIEKIRAEIMSRPELQNVKAVKEGMVYVICGHIASCGGASGCRGFVQTASMAKWFHPELFEDLDPKAIHQEYLTRFQGLDIDLDEKGVFAYPEPS